MTTAAEVFEMSEKFRSLKQELTPVEQWFDAQLLCFIEDKISKGELTTTARHRNFELLVVSSAYAVFVAPQETVWDATVNDLVECTTLKVAVPLIFMAREEN